jgi:hypothetical protein
MGEKMEIDPKMNGIHSLAEGLKAFERFHEDQTDIFALKDSILRTHHGLETLFKYILYLENPVFLVPDDEKIKNVLDEYEKVYKTTAYTIFDDNLKTITLLDTIKRLRKLNKINILNDSEYSVYEDSIIKLNRLRNTLQHFKISANLDVVSRILGIAIPRSIDIIESLFEHAVIYRWSHDEASILPELNKIFPNSEKIIKLLRFRYDQLIRDAIKFFKGRTFENIILNFKIQSSGMVGPPPYMPEISAEGFLNFMADPMKIELNKRRKFFRLPDERIEEYEKLGMPSNYEANFQIGEPKLISKPTMTMGIYEGSFNINGHIDFERTEEVLKLSDAEDKIAVLKKISADLVINLDYKSEGIDNPVHYDCETILEANGKLNVILNMVPKGYEEKESELIGRYEVELNKVSSPFRFHAFKNPDNTIKRDAGHILEWNINTKGTLTFI